MKLKELKTLVAMILVKIDQMVINVKVEVHVVHVVLTKQHWKMLYREYKMILLIISFVKPFLISNAVKLILACKKCLVLV